MKLLLVFVLLAVNVYLGEEDVECIILLSVRCCFNAFSCGKIILTASFLVVKTTGVINYDASLSLIHLVGSLHIYFPPCTTTLLLLPIENIFQKW